MLSIMESVQALKQKVLVLPALEGTSTIPAIQEAKAKEFLFLSYLFCPEAVKFYFHLFQSAQVARTIFFI
jgi:hypothetical protein